MKTQENVFIIGHKNPDTDSICSAIAYADIKNRCTQGGVRYYARRAREIAGKAEENGEILEKKPVSSAIDEVYSGKLTIEPKHD